MGCPGLVGVALQGPHGGPCLGPPLRPSRGPQGAPPGRILEEVWRRKEQGIKKPKGCFDSKKGAVSAAEKMRKPYIKHCRKIATGGPRSIRGSSQGPLGASVS